MALKDYINKRQLLLSFDLRKNIQLQKELVDMTRFLDSFYDSPSLNQRKWHLFMDWSKKLEIGKIIKCAYCDNVAKWNRYDVFKKKGAYNTCCDKEECKIQNKQ